ncbi:MULTISPECIES: hypothetical protein [Spirosoma]|uniref:Uncharacterized protein n=2 Tax=Spirosoma TaxID=107 RepID=A0A6G9AWA8_9BACT|nr:MULTISPECIES: hypothetical protein [Spirosoma]QHV94021.1 hypothetical protein GJR95_02810 [Spirosoma endbachense]QIP16771.1 hypothetical protein G8759_31100 [Spirosoma aureum]
MDTPTKEFWKDRAESMASEFDLISKQINWIELKKGRETGSENLFIINPHLAFLEFVNKRRQEAEKICCK